MNEWLKEWHEWMNERKKKHSKKTNNSGITRTRHHTIHTVEKWKNKITTTVLKKRKRKEKRQKPTQPFFFNDKPATFTFKHHSHNKT